MLLRDLADVRALFSSLRGTVSGIGMTAYSRIIPAYFLQPYHIIALRKTRDLPLLRKRADIFCLEEETRDFVGEEGLNSAHLLSHPRVRKVLKNLPEPRYLLLYQSYPELEALARSEGWILLANPSSLRMRVAERVYFRRLAEDLQLNLIPGDMYPINDVYVHNYKYWAKKIDSRLVIQLPDIRQGGGRGTFFVKSMFDYQRLQDRLKGGTWRGIKLKTFSIYKYMEGIPASLTLCLTRHGILFSGLQRQLIDLPYCHDIPEDGVFCGHSWGGAPWPSDIQDEAIRQARLIGEVFSGLGYRGILGIDFLITKDTKQVYPVECNPRFTGAFPMLSLLHLRDHLIPMDVFHMLEFLDVPYQIDPVSLNSKYMASVKGSHIILFTLPGAALRGRKEPDAGLYEFDPDTGRISFLQWGSDYGDIQNERQFIIIDGPPDTGEKGVGWKDSLHRLCRVLFSYPIVDEQESLSSQAIFVANWAYETMFESHRKAVIL